MRVVSPSFFRQDLIVKTLPYRASSTPIFDICTNQKLQIKNRTKYTNTNAEGKNTAIIVLSYIFCP